MDTQQTTDKQRLKTYYRTTASNLRLLLKYDLYRAIGEFVKVQNRDTTYIWNHNTHNIIATIRDTDKRLVRYRPASWYAPTIVTWGKSTGAICLPSTNVGRRHRRIMRNLGASPRTRGQALERLREQTGRFWLYDGLTNTTIGTRTATPTESQPRPEGTLASLHELDSEATMWSRRMADSLRSDDTIGHEVAFHHYREVISSVNTHYGPGRARELDERLIGQPQATEGGWASASVIPPPSIPSIAQDVTYHSDRAQWTYTMPTLSREDMSQAAYTSDAWRISGSSDDVFAGSGLSLQANIRAPRQQPVPQAFQNLTTASSGELTEQTLTDVLTRLQLDTPPPRTMIMDDYDTTTTEATDD